MPRITIGATIVTTPGEPANFASSLRVLSQTVRWWPLPTSQAGVIVSQTPEPPLRPNGSGAHSRGRSFVVWAAACPAAHRQNAAAAPRAENGAHRLVMTL